MASSLVRVPAVFTRSAGAARASRSFSTVTRAGGLRPIVRAGDCECSSPTDGTARFAKVNGKEVSAPALRSLSLLDVDGARVTLGDKMAPGAVVVFLRHLG